jgi:hypothetical protein
MLHESDLKHLFIFGAVSLLANLAQAEELPHVSFTHLDWEIACDNTRTCRAAGYQSDGEEPPMSVLLTRKAGPREPVTAQLQIGNYDSEELFKKLPATFTLTTKIDGRSLGKVAVSQKSLTVDLPPKQFEALLAALTGNSAIQWSQGDVVWRLSSKGATAVLLKMDEFQGRLGTTGALVRKGAKGEDAVLPALPAQVVTAAPIPQPKVADDRLIPTQGKAVLAALRKAVKDDDCAELNEAGKGKGELSLTRLSNSKLLAAVHCWSAAYNEGTGYWVINDTRPYAPVLVTTFGSDFADGTISAAQKGRGLGDCWGTEAWTWDGVRFVHTGSSSTGMCRLVAPGGAWTLPTIVTDVRKTGAK